MEKVMKILMSLIGFLVLCILMGCGGKKQGPDVSKITVQLDVKRFEQDFFQIDSNQIQKGLQSLQQGYPLFANDFTTHILGAGPIGDTQTVTQQAAGAFLRSYFPVYTDIKRQYASFDDQEDAFKSAFQHVKYYHPNYQIPRVITYVGPFDAPAVAITQEGLAIGLQLFMGKDYPFYVSQQGQLLYPAYISRRFEKNYIVPSAMMAVAQELYPESTASLPLVERMIEKGKYWYLLEKWMPGISDSVLTGYETRQLQWAKENEGMIWNYLLQQSHVYTTDIGIMQLYLGEAPQTQGFPDNSPGNIGQWIGWRIIQAYEAKSGVTDPATIMKTPAKQIVAGAKYKPK
jgi:hypothetical protein